MSTTRALAWLAPVVGVVCTVLVYRAVHGREEGLYAGAEPVLAGAVMAAPFAALALAQLGCAIGVHASRTTSSRRGWAVATAVLTLLALLGVLRIA